MKVLLSVLDRNIFDPQRREASFEYMSFYLTLKKILGDNLIYYPQDDIWAKGGALYSAELRERLLCEQPDVFLFVPHPLLDKKMVREISEQTKIVTLAFVFDDDVGFYDSSRFWGKQVNWIVSFYPRVARAYQRRGINVLMNNWACNTDFFRPTANSQQPAAKDIDASFVGAAKPERVETIKQLNNLGITVTTYGRGWPNGMVTDQQLVEIINRSKINLNLGHAPSLWTWKSLARLFFKRSKRFSIVPDFWHLYSNTITLNNAKRHPQARCRPFEILGCRTLLITNRNAVVVGEPYVENKEIIYYDSDFDLAEKIKYYLAHDGEREQIAEAGYRKTIREHSFRKRFEDIFKLIFSANPKRKLYRCTWPLPDLPYIS